MRLYKYLSNERLDVLENLSIRFTQPQFLNDPFEGNPIMNCLGIDQETLNKTFEYECRQKGISTEPFFDETGNAKIDFDSVAPIIRNLLNNTTAILSLSETFDNLLMWSHYANNHQGMVIELDTSHEFFLSSSPEMYQSLRQVKYSNERPTGSMLQVLKSDHIFRKSKEWEYEKEWRCIKTPKEADSINLNQNLNMAICLYKIPKDAIKRVIIGANMDLSDEDRLIQACFKNIGDDIIIEKMYLKPNEYGLLNVSLEDWQEYKLQLINGSLPDLLYKLSKHSNKELTSNNSSK